MNSALTMLPRADMISNALNEYGLIVVCETPTEALELANDWAPEHLSLHTETAVDDVDAVPNAGSVFVGHWSSEAAGDYATGANHVLPTGGLARSYGPLSVDDFGSYRQVQTLTKRGLERLAPTILALAGAEGLDAHAYSVTARLDGKR
jgi:histidinol dehydrogenase